MRSGFILLNATLAKNVFDRRSVRRNEWNINNVGRGQSAVLSSSLWCAFFWRRTWKALFGLPGILKSACYFHSSGAVASFFSQRRSPETSVWRNAGGTLFDAHYAAVFSPTRSFWQELAWLLSAVFWCALGALCFLFISSLFKPQHRKISKALNARACQTIRRPDFLSPMQQNRYSRRYVADRQKSAARFLRVYLPLL